MSYFKSIKFLLGTEFKKIFLMSFLFLFASLLDLLGISLIGGYIAVIFDPNVINVISNYEFLSFLLAYTHSEFVIFVGLLLIGVFCIKFIFLLLTNYVIIAFAAFEQAKIQKLLVNGIITQSYENFLLTNASENISSIANFSGVYREVLQAILQTISNIIIILVIGIFLGVTSLSTLSVLILMMSLIFGLYNFMFSKRIFLYGKDYSNGMSGMIQGTTEISNGLKEIKTLGKEKFFLSWVSRSVDLVAKSALKINFLGLIPRNLIEVILIVFVVFIVAININNSATLGQTLSMLGVFTAGMVRIAPLISQIQTSWNAIIYGETPLMKLSSIIENQISGANGNQHTFEIKSSLSSDQNERFREMVLENISYSYPQSESKSIDKISFRIEKGDFIGIVGPSGAGKTSLINIILGFLSPTNGSILFNDKELQTNLHSWRKKCAYLPQDIFLINGSLKENITLTRESENDLFLGQALKLSKLEDFVLTLPEGIETGLGDNGIRISGGQKQRVAIARAIYHQREILLLDESTSALDSQTEKEVMNELIGLRGEKTIIAIAHRITTLKECNKIYKLDKGLLSGPFDYNDIATQ
jgi:ABC-type bacteriocin/lantibiotic exporter with double-glycine peptidase domain